ncbi:unnamed protein product, partial [marine sediment metagenome]
AVTLAVPAAGRAIMVPAGAAIVSLDNEAEVDELAAWIHPESLETNDPVAVNPHLALVSGQELLGDQADWFILWAMSVECDGDDSCSYWAGLKSKIEAGDIPAVSVDDNVEIFDPAFRDAANGSGLSEIEAVKAGPLRLRLLRTFEWDPDSYTEGPDIKVAISSQS